MADVHICRVCLEAGGPKISPCACRGTLKFVHKQCLKEWQKSALFSENQRRAFFCNICGSAYGKKYSFVSQRHLFFLEQKKLIDLNNGDHTASGEIPSLTCMASAIASLSRKFFAAVTQPSSFLKVLFFSMLTVILPHLVLGYYTLVFAFKCPILPPFDYLSPVVASNNESANTVYVANDPEECENQHKTQIIKEGVILVASRNLGSIFYRSILLIIEHGSWGTKAVILNKPLPQAQRLGLLNHDQQHFSIGIGGPVEAQTLTILYTRPLCMSPEGALGLIPSEEEEEPADYGKEGGETASSQIFPGLYMSSQFSHFMKLLKHWRKEEREVDGNRPEKIKDSSLFAHAFFGYAGWSAGQLESELARGDWYVYQHDDENVEVKYDVILEAINSSGEGAAGLWEELVCLEEEAQVNG